MRRIWRRQRAESVFDPRVSASIHARISGSRVKSRFSWGTGKRRPGAASYVVQPGDTLWGIARSLQPDGDVRPLVGELTRVNGGAELTVGQRLVMP